MNVTALSAAPSAATTRLEQEIADHREALATFVATAEALSPEAWNATRPGDKWSPAQIAEHLRITYVTVRAELAGQSGMRVRTKWWQRRFLRLVYLRRILNQGQFPEGVRAVRELRPGSGPFDRTKVLGELRREGDDFIATARASRGGNAHITHPFLGPIGLVDGVRFLTQHIRHHHAQVGA